MSILYVFIASSDLVCSVVHIIYIYCRVLYLWYYISIRERGDANDICSVFIQFDDCWRLAVMGIFLLLFDTSFVLLCEFCVLLGLVFLIYCFRVLFCSYNCGEVNVSDVYLVVVNFDHR